MSANIVLGIVGLIIVLILVLFIGISNRINVYKVTITESKSTVDIALGKRYDIITEMAAVAKKYALHEKETLTELVAVRSGGTIQDTNRVIENQNKVLRQIFAISENYPQLASSELYLKLMSEIKDQNEYLAAAKRTVNSNISTLNQYIVTFPRIIVAGIKGIHQMEFLQEENLEKKKNFTVNDVL